MKHGCGVLLLGLSAAISFSGCTTSTMSCQDAVVGLAFVRFTEAELDTLVAEQFPAGNGFVTPSRVDTVTDAAIFFQRRGDTLIPSYDASLQLAPGRDYRVTVLSTGTRITVSGIVQEGQQSNTVRHARWSRVELASCINAVVGFSQDGRPVPVPEPELRGATAVVVR